MKLRAFAVGKVNTALLPCDGYGLVGSDEGRKKFCSWPGSSRESAVISLYYLSYCFKFLFLARILS